MSHIRDWQITAAPALEPVTLAEAKLHLRVDIDDDDELITDFITTALIWCEGFQNRSYLEQTITAKLDTLKGTIQLPAPLLISVTSVKYLDSNGAQQTVSTSIYDVDTTSEPGLITLAFNQSWPIFRSIHHSIEIIFIAGYGDTANDVPSNVKSAIKMLLAHLYENREATSEINLKEIPLGVKSLLYIDRVF